MMRASLLGCSRMTTVWLKISEMNEDKSQSEINLLLIDSILDDARTGRHTCTAFLTSSLRASVMSA